MKYQCQNLTETKRNELLKLLQKSKSFLWDIWHLENRSSMLLNKK